MTKNSRKCIKDPYNVHFVKGHNCFKTAVIKNSKENLGEVVDTIMSFLCVQRSEDSVNEEHVFHSRKENGCERINE